MDPSRIAWSHTTISLTTRDFVLAALSAALFCLGCYEPCQSDADCQLGLVCIDAAAEASGDTAVLKKQRGFCAPTDRSACEQSGGEWDPDSCGHYECGLFPDCDAVIPGCNCGPGQRFESGSGCVPSDDCPQVCDFDEDCAPGEICEGSSVCPPDVVCIWEGEPGICVPAEESG
jgi:hypothetical protein